MAKHAYMAAAVLNNSFFLLLIIWWIYGGHAYMAENVLGQTAAIFKAVSAV